MRTFAMWITASIASLPLVVVTVKVIFARTKRGRAATKRWKTAAVCVAAFAALLLAAAVMTAMCWKGCGPPVHTPGPYITYFPQRTWVDSSPKLILFWTTNYGYPYWGLPSDYKFEGCRVSSCKITIDRADFDKSDAVFFHGRTLWNYYLGHNVPEYHPEHQVWVYFDLEPTTQVYLDMKSYNNFFNWTWTYRTDSDIVVPYGRMIRIDNESISWETETDLKLKAAGNRMFDQMPDNERSSTVRRNYFREKTKLAAWTASNCVAHSRRYRVVKQLRQYLDIDLFGSCGELTLKCSNKNKITREECEDELGQYKFYLAFENSVCKDYHSEKLWYALQRAQIPIVYGGCDYSMFLPRNTFIDVSDFGSIKELAEYIKKVAANEELYNSYLWWRDYYTVTTYPCTFCEMCAALHDRSRPAQVYSDLDGWFRNDTCQGFSILDGVAKVVEGWLLLYDIVD